MSSISSATESRVAARPRQLRAQRARGSSGGCRARSASRFAPGCSSRARILRVVERQRGRVAEPAWQARTRRSSKLASLAEPVDAERALDGVAGDQRHGDQRLALVRRRARHDHRSAGRGGLRSSAPAPDAARPSPRCRRRTRILLRMISSAQRSRASTGTSSVWVLVGLEDAERVVGDQLGERVRDPVEQRVEACSDRTWWKTSASRRYESTRSCRSGWPFTVVGMPPEAWHGEGRRRHSIHALHLWRTAIGISTPVRGSQVWSFATPRCSNCWLRARHSVAPASVDGGHRPGAPTRRYRAGAERRCGRSDRARGRLTTTTSSALRVASAWRTGLEGARNRGNVARPEVADGGLAVSEVVEVGVGPDREDALSRKRVRAHVARDCGVVDEVRIGRPDQSLACSVGSPRRRAAPVPASQPPLPRYRRDRGSRRGETQGADANCRQQGERRHELDVVVRVEVAAGDGAEDGRAQPDACQ